MFEKFSFKTGKTDEPSLASHKVNKIPVHVAIIMDGNGRWAKRRGLPRIAGHREAMKTIKRVTKEADRLGIKVLTLYAFSTENWKRPKPEVDFLMKLPQQFLNSYLNELIEQNVQVRTMGDLSRLPSHTLQAVEHAVARTQKNTGLILNFALNYGSHLEIVRAMKAIIQEVGDNRLDAEAVTEEVVARHLMSPALPDPDLLIRTGGEVRLSNFMLWQLAYTELYFSDEYWPDFNEQSLQKAVSIFASRQRRYGGLMEGSEEN
ncbi:isoprenyl transferase [Sporolactobacillus sp. CPB3-1]|uniref:Isoprenyl transferase n=1 Tax=Sporolactobacillus mangiferae TaxID=2940498 RepID=A0ABT0M7L3_9BACL|nr:isoprenyl transferase [Sporolactobacillus mangiferae]MCL1630854.1 isoprenyl transferase [Sporolactobacillus mangiferae]